MPVAPRQSKKAQKIFEAILGTPQNQPPKRTSKKKERDRPEVDEIMGGRSKTG